MLNIKLFSILTTFKQIPIQNTQVPHAFSHVLTDWSQTGPLLSVLGIRKGLAGFPFLV